MFKKYFTPQEANRRLPLIKKIVEDILQKGKELKRLTPSYENALIKTKCDQLASEMEVLMAELENLGCFFKDWNFEIGLIDFPSKMNDQEILLCWRSDEPKVAFYHSVDDGYAGRQAIPEHWLIDLEGMMH